MSEIDQELVSNVSNLLDETETGLGKNIQFFTGFTNLPHNPLLVKEGERRGG